MQRLPPPVTGAVTRETRFRAARHRGETRRAETGRAPNRNNAMSRLPLLFVIAAAASLVVGVGFGMYMGIVHDFALAPVHAHVNLIGWASLALMGLTMRAWPALAEGRVAVVQAVLSIGSGLAVPAGIYLAISAEDPRLAIVGSVVWFAGAVLFLVRCALLAFAAPRRSAAQALATAR
jgi:hypothetical protein